MGRHSPEDKGFFIGQKMGYRSNYQKLTGAIIPSSFHVHHIDFDRKNNNIYNLVALPAVLHNKYHTILLSTPKQIPQQITDNSFRFVDQYYEFLECYLDCCQWVDYRNYLLGSRPAPKDISYQPHYSFNELLENK